MADEPIYTDRDIGNTSIQTVFLVQTLLGHGHLGYQSSQEVVGLISRYMAAQMLSSHPGSSNSDDVIRLIRNAINAHNRLNKIPLADQTDEQLSAVVEYQRAAFDACKNMARAILAAAE